MYKLMGGSLNWWELVAFIVQVGCDLEMLLFPVDYLVQVFGPGVMESYDEAIWLVRAGAMTGFVWNIGVFWFTGYSAFAPINAVKYCFDMIQMFLNAFLLAFFAASYPLFKSAIRQQAWIIQLMIFAIFTIGWGLNAMTHRPEGDVRVNYSNTAMKVEPRGKTPMKKKKA
ncbi:unnamed protein product [Amoebophrya sp. A120]|nr:unnamed protein product [Amoebophrya sp. A120]|eukprot:GSA120T00014987001.1